MAKKTEVGARHVVRAYPKMEAGEGNVIAARVGGSGEIAALLGMKKTDDAAQGVFYAALEALGASAKEKA